jgi:hypothetical protein
VEGKLSLGRGAVIGKAFGLRIEHGNGGLIHVANPELANNLLAKTRIPDFAGLGDDHVVRLQQRARQPVFGVDHPGGVSTRRGKGFQRVGPGGAVVQIDLRQELAHLGVDVDAVFDLLFHESRTLAHLRHPRHALIHITLHPGQHHCQELLAAVLALDHAFQGETGHAREQ